MWIERPLPLLSPGICFLGLCFLWVGDWDGQHRHGHCRGCPWGVPTRSTAGSWRGLVPTLSAARKSLSVTATKQSPGCISLFFVTWDGQPGAEGGLGQVLGCCWLWLGMRFVSKPFLITGAFRRQLSRMRDARLCRRTASQQPGTAGIASLAWPLSPQLHPGPGRARRMGLQGDCDLPPLGTEVFWSPLKHTRLLRRALSRNNLSDLSGTKVLS